MMKTGLPYYYHRLLRVAPSGWKLWFVDIIRGSWDNRRLPLTELLIWRYQKVVQRGSECTSYFMSCVVAWSFYGLFSDLLTGLSWRAYLHGPRSHYSPERAWKKWGISQTKQRKLSDSGPKLFGWALILARATLYSFGSSSISWHKVE